MNHKMLTDYPYPAFHICDLGACGGHLQGGDGGGCFQERLQ